MFTYKDYLYAIALACNQQADIYGAWPRADDYEDGFMSHVQDELLLLSDEIKHFLAEKEKPSAFLKMIFDDITQDMGRCPKQKAEDIACLLIEKMDEQRKSQPPFSYSQEDHDRGLQRLFTNLEKIGHGKFSMPDTSKQVLRDFESFSRGVNEGADFAFECVLPKIITDYPDMVVLQISPYWPHRVAEATLQKYVM